MSLVQTMETEDMEDGQPTRLRPKVGRIPPTLRLHNAQEEESQRDHPDDATLSARKSDSYFLFLLVGLFIVVNIALVTLLNQRNKTPHAPLTAPVAGNAISNAPAPLTITHGSSAPSTENAPAHSPITPLTPAPAAPEHAAAPVAQAPQPVAPKAYITPVSPDTTRAVAAPVTKVTATDTHPVVHEAAAPVAAASTQLPAVAPTAGLQTLPAAAPAITPDTARQDLLSVINKD